MSCFQITVFKAQDLNSHITFIMFHDTYAHCAVRDGTAMPALFLLFPNLVSSPNIGRPVGQVQTKNVVMCFLQPDKRSPPVVGDIKR
jgi:hypothetical protein